MRRFSIMVVLLAAACGDDALSDMEPGAFGCPDNWDSISLTVTPAEVDRGAAEQLHLAWELREVLTGGAEASLDLGEALRITLTVPLVRVDGSAPTTYVADLLNPYGLVAPVGVVRVLAEGRPADGCRTSASATTSFSVR